MKPIQLVKIAHAYKQWQFPFPYPCRRILPCLYVFKNGLSERVKLTDRLVLDALRLDIPRATEYLMAERLGFLKSDCLTASFYCGDCIARIRYGESFFNAEYSIV
jgi:hypothetical protein